VKTKPTTKAANVRTLHERYEDACEGIRAALKSAGHDGEHDRRDCIKAHGSHYRQWFVGEGEATSRVVLEEKTTWRGANPADPSLHVSVSSQPVRGTYGKAQTVPFRQRADGSWNYEAVVSAAVNMSGRRREEDKAHKDQERARHQEAKLEGDEVAVLPYQEAQRERATFGARDEGWRAVRIRAQPEGGDPTYDLGLQSVRMPLSKVSVVLSLLAEIARGRHASHFDGGCPCPGTYDERECANTGCKQCKAARKKR
jgi:hypothetical protein